MGWQGQKARLDPLPCYERMGAGGKLDLLGNFIKLKRYIKGG